MKTFADTSFFLLFEEILRKDKPKNAPDIWSASGVTWHHSRHTYESQAYGFTTEVFEIANADKNGWSLMVVKEHWWAGRYGETIRSAHWAKPMSGSRTAIIGWLKTRQREIEGTL